MSKSTERATKQPARRSPTSPFFSKGGSAGAFFQPKLQVGAPGDRFEQEADRSADRAMAEPAGHAPAKPSFFSAVPTVQREPQAQPPALSQTGAIASESLSLVYDQLKDQPGFDEWKEKQTAALKLRLWESQPAELRAGIVSFGLSSVGILGSTLALDPRYRREALDTLQNTNVLLPLSLLPYSEYLPLSGFKYTLPTAANAPYTFQTEFDFDAWFKLARESWNIPKVGLSVGADSAYKQQGGFSALTGGHIKLKFGGGIVNLTGYINEPLPPTPVLISDPTQGDSPTWLMRSFPDQLEANLPKGSGVFLTVDVLRLPELFKSNVPKRETAVQRKEGSSPDASASPGAVPLSVNRELHSGTVEALPPSTRAFMEQRFGHDFSGVRVHSGEHAAESAQSINARAYTSGNDIVFNSGEYQPHTPSGQRLLAHELVHTLQQTGGVQRKTPSVQASIVDDRRELPEEGRYERGLLKLNEPVASEGDEAKTGSPTPVATSAPEQSSISAELAMRLPSTGGQPLDPDIRREFEARFGMPLGAARMHAGPEADAASQALNTRAFAIGGNVGFRAGQYQPQSAAGRALLAHELTHVAQFARAGAPSPESHDVKVSDESHPLEAEASAVAMQEARGDDWRFTPSARHAGTIFREPHPAPPLPKPAEHLLADSENFKWIGAVNAPILVVRTKWLINAVGVSRGARTVDGSAHPVFMKAALSALIDRYPWAAAEREQALKDVGTLQISLGNNWAKDEEQQVNLSHRLFGRIGMPPEAPIQVYPNKSGVEIYADLRQFIPRDAKPDAIEALKAAVAERITRALETHAKQPMPAGMRLIFVKRVREALPSSRRTFIAPISERNLRALFGERGWTAALAGREPEEGTGTVAVFAVAGGGYTLPSDLSATDRETVTRLLARIIGGATPGTPEPQKPLTLGHVDVQALLDLAKQPDPIRDKIIARLQRGRHAANLNKPQSVSELIEIADAQADIEQAAADLGYKLPEKVSDIVPIVSRPVHGRILNKSGMLVPGMEGKFEFETLDQVDAFRVPHVDIQWYAAKAGAPANTAPVRKERTQYMELYADGVFNDREFTATFDKVGNYEIHAFVSHNFYLPAHFAIPVEVKTEHSRLLEQEQDSGAGAFGKATGAPKLYKFADVQAQAQGIQTTIEIASGLGGAALGSASSNLRFSVPELSEDETRGLRTEGTLSTSTFGSPGGSLAASRRTIQQEIDSLDRLITQYGTTGGSEDLKEWAIDRHDRLVATRDKLSDISGSALNEPIAVQGSYVTRTPGQRNGALKLAAWFTYEPDASGNGGTYNGHLFDHSEIVRTEDFHFRASDSSYEGMMESLFFDLSRTYPNGTMSFSFQLYEGLKASRRFIRFERVTDTPLQDIRNVMFSEPVSIAVNIAAAILTIFPPTAPIGIAISLTYNGLNAGLNMADAMRTDTVRASNYIDIGLVALDVIPLLGKASKLLKIGETGYHVLSAGQHAGMAYMFTESTYLQVRQLRDGKVTELAQLRDEIATLEATNKSDPDLARKRIYAKGLEQEIRNAAVDIFTDAALHQGITMAAQHAITRAVAAHIEGGSGSRPVAEDNEGRPTPLDEGRPGGVKPEGDPGIVRIQDEAVRGGGGHAASDPVLSRALPADLQEKVSVFRGPPPEAHGIEVHYKIDPLGLITEIEIHAGPDAQPHQIEQHVGVVRTMQRYRGIGGRLRILFERLRALAGRRVAFLPGSALFEASLEVEKLPAIIAERAEQLSKHGLEPDVRRDLEADLEHLQKELERHERTVAQAEEEAGVGFVAQTVPKSNAGAIAAGYPALEGANAAPGHYYKRTPAGTYELRRFAGSDDKPKRLARGKEGGKEVWRVVERPEEPRSRESFLELQRGAFGDPLTDNPALEAALARRFAGNKTDQTGSAIARRWGKALKTLHEGAGQGGPALLERLLDTLDSSTTDTSYGKFRREVRGAMVDQAVSMATPQAQVERIRALIDALPDPRSKGEVFTGFRERLARGTGSPISYMEPIAGAETRIAREGEKPPASTDRVADGAVNIKAAQTGGPPPGRYLAEDKSGTSFDAAQAKAYHDRLKEGGNIISAVDGTKYGGVIYSFDSEAGARSAMSTLGGLNKNIHVGFFDARGGFVWLR